METKLFLFILFLSLSSFGQQNKQVSSSDSSVKYITVIDTEKVNPQATYIKSEAEKKDWTEIWLPVFVALLVAIGAYIGVIKQSKASSISGFRVNWIEDLRVSYSKFLIALRNVDNKIRSGTINPKVYSKDNDEEDLQFFKTKIKLLLNNNPTTNPDHVEFYKQLIQYMEEHKEYYRGNMTEDEANALEERKAKMEEILSDIFKKEWEKAKKFD